LVVEKKQDHTRVAVVPVTHTFPEPPDAAIAVPPETKRRLGLDGERSWIIVSEANDFFWPGPDLRFVPGGAAERSAYWFLPPGLFRALRERFLSRARAGRPGLVPRSE
jgi:hypothetical protein